MAIIWNKEEHTISLQTKTSTYQMKIDSYGYVLHTYYGAKMEEPQDLSYRFSYEDRGFSGNPYELEDNRRYSLDYLPQEYSCFGAGDFRSPALKVRYANGSHATKLRYKSHEITEGKYAIPGLPAVFAKEDQAQTLKLMLEDSETGLEVCLLYGVMEEQDAITRAVTITNACRETIYLEKAMSGELDFIDGEFDLITFYGRHTMERVYSRNPIHHGMQSVGSSRGQSSHHYNPAMILCDKTATETTGNCYGLSFVYSGDFTGEADHDFIDQTRVLMGIGTENFTYELKAGEAFDTPELVMIYSGEGLGAMSRNYHSLYRSHLCRGKYSTARRPILINNWEGTYFDFTGEKLLNIAKEAADLGVELFVMDDGWFGKRDNDVSGLGDWTVNEKKLGCTLKKLGEDLNAAGMQFGIWFEPECISEDSDLYRAHPDWAFQIPGKKPTRSRYQLILDYSREDVRENIYNQICAVLDSANITYVKWDFNRSICDFYNAQLPAEKQGEVAHRYVLGLYDMLEKLVTRYPDILFEGCSGGGGRFDAGMLYYTPQIWCSDDTDPIERLTIQYGTSFMYPVSTMGAHVSASPNHQTGRKTPLHTRGVAAMSGTFGYELDVNKMTEEEKTEIRAQIASFKEISEVLQYGDYYRLTSPFENPYDTAWEMVSPDQKKAVVNIVNTRVQPNGVPVYLRLKGLQADRKYKMEDKLYSGAALMQAGILLPVPSEEYQAWQYVLTMEE